MRFLSACGLQKTDKIPVWFMRQAGRSLPEYRALRKTGDILAAIRNPEVAYEITMQPVRRHKVDAAILFCDIVVPLAAIDPSISIVPGTGPVISSPFRGRSDLARIRDLDPEEDIPYVLETVKALSNQEVPLIGFAGAPFTLASYLIEGGPSRDHARTKALMIDDPQLFQDLLSRLARLSSSFLGAQIQAGARAVQLFDSWVGTLSKQDYVAHVQAHTREIFENVAVPTIHYGLGTDHLIESISQTGPRVISLDWRTPLDLARTRYGSRFAIQGNLDPSVLLASPEAAFAQVRSTLIKAGPEPGYIFNLGHGVLPETDPEILTEIVKIVHDHDVK